MKIKKSEVYLIVQDIIQSELSLDTKIDADMFLDDLMGDREIDLPAIIMECEREFCIEIPDVEIEELETVEELVELVEEKIVDQHNII